LKALCAERQYTASADTSRKRNVVRANIGKVTLLLAVIGSLCWTRGGAIGLAARKGAHDGQAHATGATPT